MSSYTPATSNAAVTTMAHVVTDEDEGGNIDIDAMERALAQHAEELRLARCVFICVCMCAECTCVLLICERQSRRPLAREILRVFCVCVCVCVSCA